VRIAYKLSRLHKGQISAKGGPVKRPNLTLALAAVLCVITAVIGFGGDYINSLFRSWSPSQALVASAPQPATEAPPAAAEPESQRDES
jgi:hypothetical protein